MVSRDSTVVIPDITTVIMATNIKENQESLSKAPGFLSLIELILHNFSALQVKSFFLCFSHGKGLPW